MKLIDTSSWVHYLRGSDHQAVSRVEMLILGDEAGWCEMVAAELWNGVRTEAERKKLKSLDRVATNFPVTSNVWNKSFTLATECRKQGITAPVSDLVIASCARHYGLEVEHDDRHFELITPISAKLFPNS